MEIDFLKINEVTSEFSIWELSPYELTFAPDLLLISQAFRVMDVYKDRV